MGFCKYGITLALVFNQFFSINPAAFHQPGQVPISPATKSTSLSPSLNEIIQQALSLKTEHRYQEAETAFQTLVGDNPGIADLHYHLAVLMGINSPDNEQAVYHLGKAIELDPVPDRYLETLAETQQRLERYLDAIETYELLLHRKPDNLEYNYRIAALLNVKGKPRECLDRLDRILARESGYVDALALKGRVCLQLDRIDEAENYLAKAREKLSHHLVANVESGKIARRKKQWEKAEKHFLTALDTNPFIAEIYNLLATVYMAQNRNDDAKRCFKASQHLHGMSEKQKSFYDRLLREGPVTFKEYLTLGMELAGLGHYRRARQLLETARAIDPADQFVLIPLAMVYLEIKEYEAAYETINALQNQEQWFSEEALLTLGWAAYYTGRYSVAEGAVAAARINSITSNQIVILTGKLAQRTRFKTSILWLVLFLLIISLFCKRMFLSAKKTNVR